MRIKTLGLYRLGLGRHVATQARRAADAADLRLRSFVATPISSTSSSRVDWSHPVSLVSRIQGFLTRAGGVMLTLVTGLHWRLSTGLPLRSTVALSST